MLRKINKLLAKYFGVKLIRAEHRGLFEKIKAKRSIETDRRPLYIEFIGIPAVGKTTLFKKIKCSAKSGLIRLNDFLAFKSDEWDINLLDKLEVYQKLAAYNIERTAGSDRLATDKLRFFSWYRTVIIQDATIERYNLYHTIISEEGLFHNFGPAIERLAKEEPAIYSELVKNRAIVYCYAPKERVAHQIIKREKKQGNLLPQYKTSSFEELVEVVEKSLEAKREFITSIKESLPILEIDTSNDIKSNVESIEQFILKLQQNG